MAAFRRVLVSSEARLDGDRTHFRFGVDGDVAHAFAGRQVRAAVEWCDAVRCSEAGSDYSVISSAHGPALLLECLSATQANTWCSWSGAPARALCLLQNYLGSGVYGLAQDAGRVRRDTMGVVAPGNLLDAFGPLEFRLSMFDGTTVRPVDTGASVEPWSFSLALWTVEDPAPGPMPAPAFPWYRAWLSTADRVAGTTQDSYLPFRLTTSSCAVSSGWSAGTWMAAVDAWSPVKHDSATLSPGLKLVLTGLIKNETYSDAFLPLHRSHRAGEEKQFGLRLSVKPLSADTVGHLVVSDPDALSGVRVQLLDTTTGAAPADPALISDFVFSVVVWRA